MLLDPDTIQAPFALPPLAIDHGEDDPPHLQSWDRLRITASR